MNTVCSLATVTHSVVVHARNTLDSGCCSQTISFIISVTIELLCRYFASDERGVTGVLQLCHLMITQPTWSEGGFKRAKTTIVSNSRAVMKSMERANHDKMLQAVFGDDRRCALALLTFTPSCHFLNR